MVGNFDDGCRALDCDRLLASGYTEGTGHGLDLQSGKWELEGISFMNLISKASFVNVVTCLFSVMNEFNAELGSFREC